MENKILYYPTYPYGVNQGFGNQTPLYTSLGLLGHDGIDLSAGEQICSASLEGIVTQKSLDYSRGLGVYVTSDQAYEIGLDKPYRVAMVYWHFRQDDVSLGDKISVGDRLGITDNTGISSGNHLHFAMQPLIVAPHGGLVLAFPNNGYHGFVNPSGLWNGNYAFQFKKDLYFGMNNNEEVRVLQKVLDMQQTGNFYTETLKNVIIFQKNNKILTTGYVGPLTRAALNKRLRPNV